MLEAILFASLAGLAIPVGGVAALFFGRQTALPAAWSHAVVAFGGGALISAIALVLVPQGIEPLSPLIASTAFAAGGLFFAALDAILKRSASERGQLVAMLADFIPESAALGALFATGDRGGPLLAFLIALQNLPEAFNAYREATPDGRARWGLIAAFAAIALLGPLAALSGHIFLGNREGLLGLIMVFAGGGILYLVFEDVAPGASVKGSVLPPLGAVMGFLLGLAGHLAGGG